MQKIKNSTKYVQHFSKSAIDVNKNRSNFYRPSVHSTTFKTGDIIPIYVDEILPGSTRTIDIASVVRGATPLFPVLDNAYIDYVAFSVPNRLLYEDWESFMGENKEDFWSNKQEYLIPQVTYDLPYMSNGELVQTPVDYMGLIGAIPRNPGGPGSPAVYRRSCTALYPRAYAKIWNDWYRNQNLQEPCHIYTDGVDRVVSPVQVPTGLSDYVTGAEFGLCNLRVNKFKDYFTSALPEPQKHAPITLPLGGFAPIENDLSDFGQSFKPMLYFAPSGTTNPYYNLGVFASATGEPTSPGPAVGVISGVEGSATGAPNEAYMKLRANLSEATAVTINQLRLAIKTQKFYETQARGGSRYTEILLSMFGVYAQDSRLQRAEFLGGKRMNIRQTQVNQTTADGLGNTGAYSLTTGNDHIFSQSFAEHGILMILAYVRTDQTYYQGQEKIFARRELFDYYFPVFALLGEMPVRMKEIYMTGEDSDNEVFGYQEAYAEYRYKPNRVSGELVPQGAYGAYTYANDYASAPTLSAEFALQDDNGVKRTLAVQDDTQWIGSFYFEEKKAEVMPVYSVPSITDFF